MKRLFYILLAVVLTMYLVPTPANTAAANNCEGIKLGQKIYWEGIQLVPRQIGKLMTVKNTPLYQMTDGKVKVEKILPKGNTYRIYSFMDNYYGVGGGFVVKRDANVNYKTPSKQKLQDVKCASPESVPNPNPSTDDKPNPATTTPVNLGPQVFNLSTIASKAGMDASGNANLYMILHGTPTALAVVDLNTNELKGVYTLKNSTSAWGIDVDREGMVWIGGTNSTNLYRFDPNMNELKDYGNVMKDKSDTSIQDLTVTDHYVYGSTAYGANVFAFNKETEKTEFILPTSKVKYAKSLAVDSDDQNLYVSSGPSADLFKWDLTNKVQTSILSDVYRDDTYAEKMKRIDDKLIIKFFPSERSSIYNVSTGEFIREFKADSRGFSPKDEQTNEFYYTDQGTIYALNLENSFVRDTQAKLPKNTFALSMDFVRLHDHPEQKILTGLLDNNGTYYLYNPKTNQITIKTITPPAQPVDLYLLFSDPALKYVFSNGYMTGGITRYDPILKQSIQFNGVNQLESALFMNGKLYTGVYPRARLYEITPNEPWDQTNAKELIALDQFGQDRITAMVSHENHLFAGTYPQYTSKGGLLLDYDVNTGSYQIYDDFVSNQSVISLMQNGPMIYGGTSINANYQKDDFSAKFFRFDPQHPEEKEFIYIPVQAQMIMSLIKGPDGDIWGAADGTIFAYNPDTNTFRTVKLLNAISGNFSNATLLTGRDGFIYGTIEGRLFRLNPANMTCRILLESGAYQLTQDADGDLYFRNGATLYMYPFDQLKKLEPVEK